MKLTLLGKRLAFITAHPDDESYLVSGTIKANREAGGQSFIFCATLGEQGKACFAKPISEAKLKLIRKKELMAVSKFLGVDVLSIGSCADGKIQSQKALLYKTALQAVQKWAPDIIVSFGPDGVSGHMDHIASGEVGEKVAKKLRLPFVAFSLCPAQIRRAETLKERRKHGVYSKNIVYRKPNVKVAIAPGVKEKALGFHKSQHQHGTPFHGTPKAAIKQMLAYDYYVFKP